MAVFLTFANFALASSQFAEPVLFGRIVDRMSVGEALHRSPGVAELAPLIAAWIGFAFSRSSAWSSSAFMPTGSPSTASGGMGAYLNMSSTFPFAFMLPFIPAGC